jgi:hypothetical protein
VRGESTVHTQRLSCGVEGERADLRRLDELLQYVDSLLGCGRGNHLCGHPKAHLRVYTRISTGQRHITTGGLDSAPG